MKNLSKIILLLTPLFLGAQSCDLPSVLDGLNTGSNMTLLLNDSFISSINLNTNSPYIVALTESNLVVGSASLAQEDLNNGMQSVAIWGDDAITESIEGALSGETISLKIVDGANLFIVNTTPIIFNGNEYSLITSGSITFECTGIVLGCTETNACNFNLDATENDGSCEYAVEFYNCQGICNTDTDEDGVCDELEIAGCVEPMACNYNAFATDTVENCVYPEQYRNCEGACVSDQDGDDICDQEEVEGCTNYFACNYIAEATNDDGSCIVINATIQYDAQNGLLSLDTNIDSLDITWLYYDAVIPFEHSDSIYVLEDGVYGVLVFDPENDCGTSDTIHINVVDLNQISQPKIRIYPNPAISILNIELNKESELAIFNSNGAEMYRTKTRETAVNVAYYPSGIYFIKLVQNNNRIVYPWVKE
jgi:hypothetical protein